ncbi:MAG: hypothetical protein JST89_06190 [Cyanobacteria bacterium SZAS-4]|nr:hypothetical protein [Cyanobacteria bacterium SZAS-4]
MGHHGFGHHGGAGGHHGMQSGHPNQSPGWNSALQGLKDGSPDYSMNNAITPVIGAFVVFLLMFLGLAVDWNDFLPVKNCVPTTAEPVDSFAETYSAQPLPENNLHRRQQRYQVWVDR